MQIVTLDHILEYFSYYFIFFAGVESDGCWGLGIIKGLANWTLKIDGQRVSIR